MASSFKCPWGVKAQFTIPFKSLFYYRADKGLNGLREGDDCVFFKAGSVIQQLCYFKGQFRHGGVSLNQTYCIFPPEVILLGI